MKELTGQDIHEAYNRVLARDALRKKAARAVMITEWEDVSEENKHLYNRMALYLNVIVKGEAFPDEGVRIPPTSN